jgi:glycosyltransferase involved in cell wall biosynthesis
MSTLLALNNYYFVKGGSEVVFFEHNRMLEQDGWEIVPFSMQHEKNIASDWSPYFIDEMEFGNAHSLADKLRMAPKFVYSLEAQKKLKKLIAQCKPDIAHGHNIYHHISPSVLHTLKKAGIPTVLTLHDLKIACPAYRMLSGNKVCEKCKGGRYTEVVKNRCIKGSAIMSGLVWVEAMVHSWLSSYRKCVDAFVVPSRFFMDKLIEWGYPADRFHYVPNFVDASAFEPNYAAGDYFLFFGRLSEEKGIGTLIEAAATAGVKLKIAGTGDIEQSLRDLAQSKGADVEFLGYVSGEPLHAVIRDSRAVVLPSEWYENAPLSVMEAYALGKPVIGADIGGIPEMVEHEQTGAHFPSGDVNALSQVLAGFTARSDAEIADMGRAGREKVEREFSPERYRDAIEALYAKLQGGRA